MIIINAITPAMIAICMIVVISIPSILPLFRPLSALDDEVNVPLDEELGCVLYFIDPPAATDLLEELLLVSGGAVGLEVGVGAEVLSELGCVLYFIDPPAATYLLEGLFLVSGGAVDLEIGTGTEVLSEVGCVGGGILVFDLSTLFVEDNGGFVLVFLDESPSVDGGGVLFLDPEVGGGFVVYLLFWGGSNVLDDLAGSVAFG